MYYWEASPNTGGISMFVVVKLGMPGNGFDPSVDVVATRTTDAAAWQRARELAEAALAECGDPEAEVVDNVAFHGVREIYVDGDDGYECGWTVVVVDDDE
jgi:hypothetical protein